MYLTPDGEPFTLEIIGYVDFPASGRCWSSC